MAEPALKRMTEAEYLAFEAEADRKHHFIDGEIIAMAGGSDRHNAIASNVLIALGLALRDGPCRPVGSDQRHQVAATGLYTYPDVTIRCRDDAGDARSPVLVEVLSASTESLDRGRKFVHLQQDPGVRHYVLVSQRERRVEHFRRVDADRWELTILRGEDAVLHLDDPAATVPLAEIYRDVAGEKSDDEHAPYALG
jgi:Uma2 family endonuclease